jgi:acetoin:2,6-dichlorophenolindophenol oxidoreductase subunit beta
MPVATMTMTYAQAIREGLAIEMRRDPDVYVAGEDVGMFGAD